MARAFFASLGRDLPIAIGTMFIISRDQFGLLWIVSRIVSRSAESSSSVNGLSGAAAKSCSNAYPARRTNSFRLRIQIRASAGDHAVGYTTTANMSASTGWSTWVTIFEISGRVSSAGSMIFVARNRASRMPVSQSASPSG